MTPKKRRLAIGGGIVGGVLLIGAIATLITVQTSWFADFVRAKIIASVEESTGGKVEIGSFQFDPWHLRVLIRNFVLHGTEARTEAPLAQAVLLEVDLRLFSGIAHTLDLAYIGLSQPHVNLIAYPDGTTNVPQPKVVTQPSDTNSLETIVNLKIGSFRVTDGLLQCAQQQTRFSGRGENVKALLNYNTLTPGYAGNLSIDPVVLSVPGGQPLEVHVNLPVTIDKNSIRLANATLQSAESKIGINASLEQINAPVIDGQIDLSASLPELKRSFDLSLDTTTLGLPRTLTAQLTAHVDQKTSAMEVRTAHVVLGDTRLDGSGTLRDPQHPESAAPFHGSLALDQLSRLFEVSTADPATPRIQGVLAIDGAAKLDTQNNYQVSGQLNSRGVSIHAGKADLSAVALSTPFHADPYLISLDGLRLDALGGTLRAKLFIEKLTKLSIEGELHGFSLPVLARAATGEPLGYDGALSGMIKVTADLNSKGMRGYRANARLNIQPGAAGVPISGFIQAAYSGATDSVDLQQSYVAMPHSRLDLAGALNKELDLNLVSHNLNDFLPAVNFGAKQPQSSFPVTLAGNGQAQVQAAVTGKLADPKITGHAGVDHFVIEQQPFDRFALDLAAAQTGATVQNGELTRGSLRSTFDASIGLQKWSPLPMSAIQANLSLHNARVPELLSLAGPSSIPSAGDLNADVHINGTYGNPLGSAVVNVVNGSFYGQPLQKLSAQVNLADQLITLAPLEVATEGGTIDVTVSYRHPRDSFTIGNAQLQVRSAGIDLTKLKGLQQRNKGLSGMIQLSADAAAHVREVTTKPGEKTSTVDVQNLTADLAARGLRLQNQPAGDLTFTARTANGNVSYQLASNLAGSQIHVDGQTGLVEPYTTTADAAIADLSVKKILALAGQGTIPAVGTFSANAHVDGTLKAPAAKLDFALLNAEIYQEKMDKLAGSLRYSNQLVEVPSLEIDTPAGSLNLVASFAHPANDFNAGTMKLNVKTSDIDLARIYHVHVEEPTLLGTAHMAADLSATMKEENGKSSLLVTNLNANAGTAGLNLNHLDLGNATFAAVTHGQAVDYRLDADIAKSEIHAAGQTQLAGDYQTGAQLKFANIRYVNLAPFLQPEQVAAPAFEAIVEGSASVNGPVLNADLLTARLQLSRLEADSVPVQRPTGGPAHHKMQIANVGPVVVALAHSVVNIQQFHLKGEGTTVDAGGTIDLTGGASPLNVQMNANLDLGMLGEADRDFYANGAVTADVALHGTMAQPLVNGRIELKNANINNSLSPNGLSNGNGVILLTGTGANIQNLTGESGGGEISVTGFAGFSGPTITYNLKAAAKAVRVRYSGLSVTSDATITLVGNPRRSLVQGNVTISRIAYNSSSDAGSLLSSFASTPPSTSAVPSALLANMRLDVHVLTAPDLRVVTTYADRLSVQANLALRGTATTPGMVGRVTITEGELVFFGNTYTVNTGTINFYNPSAIDPTINVSLETLAQGVDVTLGVTGPMTNLQLSYKSDPPLSFEQIVQLLATNTTPNDPNIVANQPTAPQQSFTQMGESAILGQAVADPLASRVQRVFGLSQFKIDPSVSGTNGQPSARVTLQQKIASNITFTYITDVTQTNSEIVKVQWDLSPKLSAVGLRDFNGDVSLVMYYKFVRR